MSAKSYIRQFAARFRADNRGAVATEFAIILPTMLVMYFGTFEASRLIRAYLATNRAAQLMANLIAQEGSGGVTASESTDFCAAAKLVMSPFPSATFTATSASITKNVSTGTIAIDWQDTTCGGGAGSFSNATTAANGLLTTNGDTMILVKASYTYNAPIRFVLSSSYTIQQTAYQRPRTGSTIPHS
jgi:Flp pilus assembly protein TadG